METIKGELGLLTFNSTKMSDKFLRPGICRSSEFRFNPSKRDSNKHGGIRDSQRSCLIIHRFLYYAGVVTGSGVRGVGGGECPRKAHRASRQAGSRPFVGADI